MRRGFLYLMMVVTAPGAAWGQWPTAAAQIHMAANSSMTRADGTSFGGEISQPAPPVAAAISFRHYTHKPNRDALAHFYRALKAVAKNHDGEALDRLTDALRLDPEFFEAHLQMGVVWLQAEAPAEALAHLERALAIDDSSQAAQALAAYALFKVGRLADAEFAFRRAQQLGRSVPVLDDMIKYIHAERTTTTRPIP